MSTPGTSAKVVTLIRACSANLCPTTQSKHPSLRRSNTNACSRETLGPWLGSTRRSPSCDPPSQAVESCPHGFQTRKFRRQTMGRNPGAVGVSSEVVLGHREAVHVHVPAGWSSGLDQPVPRSMRTSACDVVEAAVVTVSALRSRMTRLEPCCTSCPTSASIKVCTRWALASLQPSSFSARFKASRAKGFWVKASRDQLPAGCSALARASSRTGASRP